MAEAILVDRARDDDRILSLRGVTPSAERDLRALISFASDRDEDDGGGDGTIPAASVTVMAEWVANANRLLGGDGTNA